MTTLVVKDLSFHEELDRNAMGGVRGGDSQLALGEPHLYALKLDQTLNRFSTDAPLVGTYQSRSTGEPLKVGTALIRQRPARPCRSGSSKRG